MNKATVIENLIFEAKKYRYTCGQVIKASIEVAYSYGFSNQESQEIRKEVLKTLNMN